MSRLTERFSNGDAAVAGCGNNCMHEFRYCNDGRCPTDCPTLIDILEKLARYEDLEEAANINTHTKYVAYDPLMQAIHKEFDTILHDDGHTIIMSDHVIIRDDAQGVIDMVNEQPSINIIRCEECIYYDELFFKSMTGTCKRWTTVHPTWQESFCSYAVRRKDEEVTNG